MKVSTVPLTCSLIRPRKVTLKNFFPSFFSSWFRPAVHTPPSSQPHPTSCPFFACYTRPGQDRGHQGIQEGHGEEYDTSQCKSCFLHCIFCLILFILPFFLLFIFLIIISTCIIHRTVTITKTVHSQPHVSLSFF